MVANVHALTYVNEAIEILRRLDTQAVDRMAEELAQLRAGGGRLFFLGVGGSAGNCSHAVNDFRKLCGIEAYAPTDNVSELTARINDDGWATVFAEWLKVSRAAAKDAVFVFSVGGGDAANNVSPNLVEGVREAKKRGLKVFGVVGRDGGYTKAQGDNVIVIPTVHASRVTPHTEAFHAVVWHCLVSHPALQIVATKWESVGSATVARL